jgi:hypothetical protein
MITLAIADKVLAGIWLGRLDVHVMYAVMTAYQRVDMWLAIDMIFVTRQAQENVIIGIAISSWCLHSSQKHLIAGIDEDYG